MRVGVRALLRKLRKNREQGSRFNLEWNRSRRNTRPADAPRPSCTSNGTSELHTQLQQLAKAAGLGGKVRINKSGCLDQCEHGPTMVVYPEAVWYGHVQPEDAAEIVAEHLVAGRPVERLRLDDACLNTKTCPHRG
jgi:(2Fe-2S) ferredoxin